jgi:hypothetical protein
MQFKRAAIYLREIFERVVNGLLNHNHLLARLNFLINLNILFFCLTRSSKTVPLIQYFKKLDFVQEYNPTKLLVNSFNFYDTPNIVPYTVYELVL